MCWHIAGELVRMMQGTAGSGSQLAQLSFGCEKNFPAASARAVARLVFVRSAKDVAGLVRNDAIDVRVAALKSRTG